MKHRKNIPSFEHPQGRGHSPADIRRIFETWIVDVAVTIGTWGPDASNQWMNIATHASQNGPQNNKLLSEVHFAM
eukprot:12927988-Prorocentrum_lima.AAC.1